MSISVTPSMAAVLAEKLARPQGLATLVVCGEQDRNLHIEFKRLDLVKRLNQVATGDAVLGEDNEG